MAEASTQLRTEPFRRSIIPVVNPATMEKIRSGWRNKLRA
jgi:hypothetical protein